MRLLNLIHGLISKFLGRNLDSAPSALILTQMNERRPLPLGVTEFEEWSNRIISGTLLPADNESMKFALSTMLMHLGPQEDHREDAYFIHTLRKSAVNQVAHAKMQEIRDAIKARTAATETKTDDQKVAEVETTAQQTMQRVHLAGKS